MARNKQSIVTVAIKNANKYKHFIKYAMIGITGVSIDMVMFYVLNKNVGMHYQLSNVISVSCGITNNFLLNAFFNFKMKDRLLIRFFQFYSIGLFGLLISAGLLYLFVEHFLILEIVAKIMTVGVVTIIQFNLNKIFTFKGYNKSQN